MRHHADRTAAGAPIVSLTREALVQLVTGAKTVEAAMAEGALRIDGDATPFADLLSWLDRFDFWFEIIEP